MTSDRPSKPPKTNRVSLTVLITIASSIVGIAVGAGAARSDFKHLTEDVAGIEVEMTAVGEKFENVGDELVEIRVDQAAEQAGRAEWRGGVDRQFKALTETVSKNTKALQDLREAVVREHRRR